MLNQNITGARKKNSRRAATETPPMTALVHPLMPPSIVLSIDSSTRENGLGGFGRVGWATHSRGGYRLLARTTQSAETKKKEGQRREIVLLV